MNKCSDECTPICNHCIFCIHEKICIDGSVYDGQPIGCKKGNKADYISGFCNDFHCIRLGDEQKPSNTEIWKDAYDIVDIFLIKWFAQRKGHRKARWKRKYKRMWLSIKKQIESVQG